jgi:hypothetical protein
VGEVITNHNYRVVVWIDPGKDTGWAIYDFLTHRFSSGEGDFFTVGDMLQDLLWVHSTHAAIGCEAFLVTPTGSQTADPEYSLKTIGMVEWLCHRNSATLLPEVPSSSRNLGRDGGKREKLDWYRPGKGHANDATAHLLAWLLREHQLPKHLMEKLFA